MSTAKKVAKPRPSSSSGRRCGTGSAGSLKPGPAPGGGGRCTYPTRPRKPISCTRGSGPSRGTATTAAVGEKGGKGKPRPKPQKGPNRGGLTRKKGEGGRSGPKMTTMAVGIGERGKGPKRGGPNRGGHTRRIGEGGRSMPGRATRRFGEGGSRPKTRRPGSGGSRKPTPRSKRRAIRNIGRYIRRRGR